MAHEIASYNMTGKLDGLIIYQVNGYSLVVSLSAIFSIKVICPDFLLRFKTLWNVVETSKPYVDSPMSL